MNAVLAAVDGIADQAAGTSRVLRNDMVEDHIPAAPHPAFRDAILLRRPGAGTLGLGILFRHAADERADLWSSSRSGAARPRSPTPV